MEIQVLLQLVRSLQPFCVRLCICRPYLCFTIFYVIYVYYGGSFLSLVDHIYISCICKPVCSGVAFCHLKDLTYIFIYLQTSVSWGSFSCYLQTSRCFTSCIGLGLRICIVYNSFPLSSSVCYQIQLWCNDDVKLTSFFIYFV